MEKIITISKRDLDYLREIIELGKNNFLHTFASMNPEDQEFVYAAFYKQVLYKFFSEVINETIKYFPKENKLEVQKCFSFHINSGYVIDSEENSKIINKDYKFSLVVFTVENLTFDGELLSFNINFPDYEKRINEIISVWGVNRKLINLDYTANSPIEITMEYWKKIVDSISFSDNHLFNRCENDENNELIKSFIDFLHQKRICIVDSLTMDYLKFVCNSATIHFPDFAYKTFEEKNNIMYRTAYYSLKWCHDFGTTGNLYLIAKVLFEILRKENCTKVIFTREKKMFLNQEKNHPNGELMWAIYDDPNSVIKTGNYFHASDLWKMIVENE